MSEPIDTISYLREYFGDLSDPRDPRGRLHPFFSLLTIAILGVICGADEWTEIEEFGKSKEAFLRQFLDLPHGIPSHDTFGRVFSLLDPEGFQACFSAWTARLADTFGEVVSIDGKQLRRSYDTQADKAAIYMVSAWANANNMVLGQVKVADKSNEITAIPRLLALLDLAGAVVSIDAIGTQREIAQQIRAAQADYLLALKANQGEIHRQTTEAFERFDAGEKDQAHQTMDLGHGRIETRTCWVASARDWLLEEDLAKWKDLNTLVKVHARIEYRNGKRQGQVSEEVRYYISSLPADAQRISRAVRSHWGIEIRLHWILDVAFGEDQSRVRKGFGAENFATLRHIALNKLKNETSLKRGIKAKRKKAGWDEDYLIKVLLA